MSRERLHKIILAPHVTEKALSADSERQYVFRVLRDATKPEIRSAVELMFDVKVDRVTTAVAKGKTKRFGAHVGRRSDWKKAYVTLQEGQQIDLAITA